jgi:hypothetical protein
MLFTTRTSFLVLLSSLSLASAACGGTSTGTGGSTTGAGPDPTSTDPITEITLPVAEVLQGRDGVLDIVRLFPDKPAVETVLPLSAETGSLTIPLEGAGAVSFSVLGTQGTLFESHGASNHCLPSFKNGLPEVLEVPTEFATIQAAIDAAEPGDRVYVHPGTYHEHLHLRPGVRLVGAGAWRTILDGDGTGENLIDFTGAKDVVVRGFTLRNVGQAGGCGQPADVFACSGDWYASAIYGDGHDNAEIEDNGGPEAGHSNCVETSIEVTQNIIEGNDIGVMLYFHARGVIHNNVFLGNRVAFVSNHMQDHAIVASNVFYDNPAMSIGSQAAYLDIINNIVVRSSVGVEHEFVQTGRIRCNVFFDVAQIGERVDIGTDGNVILDPGFLSPENLDFRLGVESGAAGLGCNVEGLGNVEGAKSEPGAFGGAMGGWHRQQVESAELEP